MSKIFDRFSPRTRWVSAGVALAAVAAVIGGSIALSLRPVPAMAPAAPTQITSLAALPSPVFGEVMTTIRGEVLAVYGDSFTMKDTSGQILVNVGRHGNSSGLFNQSNLVSSGHTVTVQGRYEDGAVRAMYLIANDGRAYAVGRGGRHQDGHGDKRRDQEHSQDAKDLQDGAADAGAATKMSTVGSSNAGGK